VSSGLHLVEQDDMYDTIPHLSRPGSFTNDGLCILLVARHWGTLSAVPSPPSASSSRAHYAHTFLNDLVLKGLLRSGLSSRGDHTFGVSVRPSWWPFEL
jgi:hypothetical protein